MKQFKLIALTHRELGLEAVGKFHVQEEDQHRFFSPHLEAFGIKEFMYLSTCNRVEFFMRTNAELTLSFVSQFLQTCFSKLEQSSILTATEKARTYEGLDAVRHVFHVASSLDSLIVGEREIITQIRKAHERAAKTRLSGDFIRIAITKSIETAKVVYTETQIATKPISVVNLGYKRLLDRDIHNKQSIVFIGAGTTIEAIAGNLKAQNFNQIKVFNRTPEKAIRLAKTLGGQGYGLTEISEKIGHFDVMICCTGSDKPIISKSMYADLVGDDNSEKIILDLAIPTDVSSDVITAYPIDYISIEDLKLEAKENLKHREREIFHCEKLVEERLVDFEESFRTRRLEKAMQEIPRLMKDIKHQALEKTFAKDLAHMNPDDREMLVDIVNYIEKKYISLPMKMAKQVILDKDLKDAIID